MFLILLVVLVFAVLYWFPIRRWMSRWGTASPDVNRVMAGDRLLVDHTYSGTMTVIINATPEDIWPWLVQMGFHRGGLYSYDWLDRLFGYLDRPSATRILPEFQHLAVGDTIPLGRGPSWPVTAIEPYHALVLDMRNMGGIDWVWQFGLYAVDDHRTQLVSRSRVRAWTLWARLLTYAIEPAGFLMTRRMLLGIKERAEGVRLVPSELIRASKGPHAPSHTDARRRWSAGGAANPNATTLFRRQPTRPPDQPGGRRRIRADVFEREGLRCDLFGRELLVRRGTRRDRGAQPGRPPERPR